MQCFLENRLKIHCVMCGITDGTFIEEPPDANFSTVNVRIETMSSHKLLSHVNTGKLQVASCLVRPTTTHANIRYFKVNDLKIFVC